MKIKKIIFIIYLFIFAPLLANENNTELSEIYKNLRCLICQGQSIADSNSDFAATIKLVVQDLVSEGKSKDEVYSFLITKYGEWIVYQPTFNKNNFLLWTLPYAVLVLGVFVIFFIVRKKQV
jgi:cytochrome c-type biogenesis protein CcmH|tara:strand:+ start:42 stop:407 length:366 start_codon:yes stop_codon:yes gene_type:complete